MFLRHRRSIRQSLFVLAFLAILTFTVKLQHMIFNLNQEQHLAFPPKHARVSTNLAGDAAREALGASQEMSRDDGEGKAFAQLGIKLVNLPIYDTDNITHEFTFVKSKIEKTGAFEKVEQFEKSGMTITNDSRFLRKSFPKKSTSFHVQTAGRKTDNSRALGESLKFKEIDEVKQFINKKSEENQSLSDNLHIINQTTSSQQDSTFPDVYLAIIVVSRPENMLYRLATRKTWARNARELGTVLRFMVGHDPNWDSLIEDEDKIHHDLVILEEDDVYDLLPTKVLEGLAWALSQKAKPRYVMKVDDDSIVNLPYLITELSNNIINSTQILGAICKDAPVVRDPSDKWAVSVLDYPLEKYPTYVAGGGYVMSAEAASDILQARSRTIGWFHLEDVYITGVLAAKAGLSHVAHPGFSYWSDEKAQPCDFLLNKRVISVGHTDVEMNKMFEKTISLIQAGGDEMCARLESSSILSVK
ncbi:beta-1,3-galactosyltransferase 1-like [Elysia marginata]|uniref:Hexosyltransferase n=1 Tax=Elysia marginata TaxID=1093978 RepID=A0AAV4JTL7_9GAST|nr:beta-1,3-galactosyltransferase 1-like [Elysia marginata]